MTIDQYLFNIRYKYKQGNATEHPLFPGNLEQLIDGLVTEIRATNEPKRQTCGASDYILTKADIPVGFIDAKGDKDLRDIRYLIAPVGGFGFPVYKSLCKENGFKL